MLRVALAAVVSLAISFSLAAQDDPQRGRIKKVDAQKATVSITAEGKDYEFAVTASITASRGASTRAARMSGRRRTRLRVSHSRTLSDRSTQRASRATTARSCSCRSA